MKIVHCNSNENELSSVLTKVISDLSRQYVLPVGKGHIDSAREAFEGNHSILLHFLFVLCTSPVLARVGDAEVKKCSSVSYGGMLISNHNIAYSTGRNRS